MGKDVVDMMGTSLDELINTDSYRWIFVGGKGGVGKTTTACSIATQFASRRESVLVLSTDPAHNLSDAFGQKLCGEPTLINGFSNLYAMEIDSNMQDTSGYNLRNDSQWAKVIPELIQYLPGIDEALSFAELMHSVQTMKYSVIILDTAPTGHTLRLLGFPQVIEEGLKKIMGVMTGLSGAFNMFNSVAGQNVNENDLVQKLEHLKAITTSIKDVFQDPTQTTFVCVCIAEFLSVYETERLVQELSKQGIDCSNIVVNQVTFPLDENIKNQMRPICDTVSNNVQELQKEVLQLRARCQKLEAAAEVLGESHRMRRLMQSKYLQQIEDLYSSDYNVVCMPQQKREVRGTKQLLCFGSRLLQKSCLPILHKAEAGAL